MIMIEKNNMRRNQAGMSRDRARWSRPALFLLAAGALAGCDGILDVEIPGQIAEDALFSPSQAPILVSAAIGNIECAYSEFVSSSAAGNEDVFMRVTGWWGGAFEYQTAPGTGNCNSSDTAFGWWTPLHYGRGMAEQTYENLSQWTEVANRDQLLAQSAIYAGVAYNLLGDYFCEVAIESGPLMTPDQTLAEAERWFTAALGHIGSADFAIPGGITSSARQMALLERARTRFARGDLSGAAADAGQISKGFMAFATRDAGGERTRWNRAVHALNQQGWGTLIGPVDWWTGPGGWPTVIPYTGYRDLGLLPDGRAVTDTGHPILTTGSAGAVADARVPVKQDFLPNGEPRIFNRFPVWHQRKYTGLDSDIPMANWEEAWLILAEIEGGQSAIDRVNEIREFHKLPLVTYLSPGDAAGIERMIIEERRRSLFLEGRFWSTKIQKNLWFPRGFDTTPYPYNYQEAVRLAMPQNEYILNSNTDLNDRGTLCDPSERPAV